MTADPAELTGVLAAWWDEASAFLVGNTSAVVADYLDDLGTPPAWCDAGLTRILRGPHHRSRVPDRYDEPLRRALRAFAVGRATSAYPEVRNAFLALHTRYRGSLGVSAALVPTVVMTERAAAAIRDSHEVAEYIRYSRHNWEDQVFGGIAFPGILPSSMFGIDVRVVPGPDDVVPRDDRLVLCAGDYRDFVRIEA